MIPNLIESNNLFSQNFDQGIHLSSNKEAAILLRFLKYLRISNLFSQLSDKRQQSKTNYSNTSLSFWAFFTLLFRQGSKNSFRTTLGGLSGKKRKAMATLLMTDDTLPHSSTVDDYLRHLDAEQLNNVLVGIFQRMQKTKVFYNHVSILMPDNRFLLGCDGFHTHTYSKPHSVDELGNNICPYCLPRRRNKGTPKEEVYWVHVFVTFVIIFRGGLKIPIYIYPLKACQVKECLSDEAFKQECELKATYAVLPIIKNQFPHTAFTFCGDGLYANEPTILLLNSLFFEYLIVRKEKSLKCLGRHCDELSKTELYQKSYVFSTCEKNGRKTITRKAQWFNNEMVGKEAGTNVLRFEETIVNHGGVLFDHYKGEWLCSKRLHKGNCFEQAKQARSRWEHEDLHNTCKRRGFEAKHDMARKDPNLCLIWKLMLFIAFSVFELFRCLKLVQDACGRRSWMKFSRDLLHQLVYEDWGEISNSSILQKEKVQFRFCFEESS